MCRVAVTGGWCGMAEETWHEARLIPTSGINGAEEQERRATSALLAVMSAVREFGRGLTKSFGAQAGFSRDLHRSAIRPRRSEALPGRSDQGQPRAEGLDSAGRGQDRLEQAGD